MKKITTVQDKVEDIVEWDLGHRRWILQMKKRFQDPEWYYRKLIALCNEHNVFLNWDSATEFYTIRNSVIEKILHFRDTSFPISLTTRVFQTEVERMFHPVSGIKFFNVKCEKPVVLNDGFVVIKN